MLIDIVKSLIIGLLVSVTLGPMGFMVIQRAINKGHRSGYASALGFILVDVIYAVIALFSVSFIVEIIKDYNNEFQFIGGVIVVIIGIGMLKSNPLKSIQDKVQRKRDLVKDFVSVFFLTLPNPSPYISFSAIFATFNLVTINHGFGDKFLMLLFLFLGMCTAWGTFLHIVIVNKKRIGMDQLVKINTVVSYLIILLGIGILLNFTYISLF